ncbi:helicase associated domain-containing protein [Rhodococcus rhodochrous]|uniref:Helicase associated domain-containing protein n=1 Tax=Rhodococcus rhodochrous TaxID=1829 RepID=A0AA46X199_RHORH|nr:helicase associated domain-containing protein [Rhodococcus rhodochrous]
MSRRTTLSWRFHAAGFETTGLGGVRGPTSLGQPQWGHGLNHLQTHVATHGNADVPRRHVTEDGFALGMWVQSGRKELRAGKLTAPSPPGGVVRGRVHGTL